MTNHSLPTGPAGSEGDSEKKKWGYKRQQFDAVISTTRFNGAIDNLVNGTVEVRALLSILDELNASNQRGRYMAEVLALKQESRRLATAPFDERIVEFLMEGSRRIPWLSDGLASQMAVALASAADNPLYLDTVNNAVGNLLLDLDRPLKPDTRNYLRALTDKIDATRRLQEARGLLATVPSVYPPTLPEQLANASSPEPPSVETISRAPELLLEADASDEATKQIARERVLSVGQVDASSDDDYLEPTEAKSGQKYTTQRTLVMPVPEVPDVSPAPALATTPSEELAVLEGAVTALADAVVPPSPARPVANVTAPPSSGNVATSQAAPPAPRLKTASSRAAGAPAASYTAEKTAPGLGRSKTAPGLSPVTPPVASTSQLQTDDDDVDAIRIPTRRIPIWIMVLAAGAIGAGGIVVWLLAHNSRVTVQAPAASASAVVSAAASVAKAPKVPPPVAPPPPAEPPPQAVAPTPPAPPVPPLAAVAPQPKPTRTAPAPIVRTPAPPAKPVHVAAPPPALKPVTHVVAPTPKPVTPQPLVPKPKPAAAAPNPEPPAAPSTPKPSRTIDDILVELLQVPNDPASIEAKAHEVARIVARAARADAEHILQRLIPEEVLAGTETVDTRALEPVRRVVALLLKKVALDKDDNRAAMAIDSLGEWAKSRKNGAAAKLTLDQLAEEPVVLSRPKRLRAIERVQARLGISNVGE
jgi:hypothetical protein